MLQTVRSLTLNNLPTDGGENLPVGHSVQFAVKKLRQPVYSVCAGWQSLFIRAKQLNIDYEWEQGSRCFI